MGMFMMIEPNLQDFIDAAKVIKNKLKSLDVEMKKLVVEQLKSMKAYSVVETKLHDICNHDWEKIGNYQFAPTVCKICTIEKRDF